MLAATSIVTSPARDGQRAERVGRLLRDLARLPGGDVEDERRELVAAEPADHVRRAQPAAKDVGGRAEHLVAGGVPGRVVHLLEVVEIEQEQRAVLAPAVHPAELALQPSMNPRRFRSPVRESWSASRRSSRSVCLRSPMSSTWTT